MKKKFNIKNIYQNPKIFFCISVISILCAVLLNLVTGIISIPSNLHLMAGASNQIKLSFPFTAAINENTVEATNISDTPVKDNINITVGKDAEEDSSLDMSLAIFGFPIKNVSLEIFPDMEVIPCGKTVGVRINTAGVLVLGTGAVDNENGKTSNPSSGKLRSGDLITGIKEKENIKNIEDKKQLQNLIENCEGNEIELLVKRDGEDITVRILPVKSILTGKYTIGAWIRDGTQGIGTVTYYNPETNTFGALGHGILDVDTKKLMTVKKGELIESSISSVKKGKKGSPGELEGDLKDNTIIGTIKTNTSLGLYGYLNKLPDEIPNEKFKVAMKNEIYEGPAVIRSNVSGKEIKEYDVYIESVNRYGTDEAKGMVVRITDQELLTRTNGIVQGMSGSPIIQNEKIIGAVTHVFVQNPSRGYGVFIENMIKQEKKMPVY